MVKNPNLKKNLQLKKKKIKGKNSKNPYPKVQRKKGKIHKQRKEPKPQKMAKISSFKTKEKIPKTQNSQNL